MLQRNCMILHSMKFRSRTDGLCDSTRNCGYIRTWLKGNYVRIVRRRRRKIAKEGSGEDGKKEDEGCGTER